MKDDGQHKLKYLYNIEKTKETEAVVGQEVGSVYDRTVLRS